jgi:dynein intermediate chain, cytosolic
MTPRFIPDLIDIEQEVFEFPQKVRNFVRINLGVVFTVIQERVIYNKEVQTSAVETDSLDVYEEEIRRKILKEQDAEIEQAARDRELEEESVQLEKEIEREIRGVFFQV